MNFLDLIKMSSGNLWRRRLRTVLTVLGVVVGTASIVVMISLGLGLTKSSMEQIEKTGGLTTIQVTSNDNGGYYGGMAMTEESSDGSSTEPIRVNDATIEMISGMEHVDLVSPVLTVYIMARQGAYEAQFELRGMSLGALEKMNLDIGEGNLPNSETELQLLYGNNVITNFYNAKKQEYYWDTQVLPDVDYMDTPMFIIFDMDAYWDSQYGGTDESGSPITPPKKYIVPAAGVLAGGPEEYSEHSYRVYCNVDALASQLKKVFKGRVIPGQPTRSNGEAYRELYYNEAYVRVTDMKYVTEVQDAIKAMGYNTYSNIEWVTQMQEQSRSIQAALGGIGAVSLLVAAIGIANTMMMSIYERTKEIGIIKVLGCEMTSIRNLFLAEAAFIGFIGGVVGLILSYTISFIINFLTKASFEGGISYIPIWLAAVALIFSVLVGMLAGLFPALRAMKLSPLAAIRNE